MRNRILDYLKWMDEMLTRDDADWGRLMKRHLREIAFFQHERLVHEFVMILFALCTVMVFLVSVVHFSLSLLILFLALLVLLVPYIRHYFLLENGVQTMYYQYDALYRKINPEAAAPKFSDVPAYVKHYSPHSL